MIVVGLLPSFSTKSACRRFSRIILLVSILFENILQDDGSNILLLKILLSSQMTRLTIILLI